MAAMTRQGDTRSAAAPTPAPEIPRRIAAGLLWSGAIACGIGFVVHALWKEWRPGRFAELLILAAVAALIAWPLRKATAWSWATCLALVLVAALILFAGPLPVLAVMLLALAAVAVGGALGGAAPLALQGACGLALLAGVLGWLLPLPLHSRWSYALLCLACIAWRHRALAATLRDARDAWKRMVDEAPRAAAWSIVAIGLASTACWLPTLQVDDLGYHLRLPWELQLHGRYAPDPWQHVWAVAPWASDVQHAVAQLIAGTEARGALNGLWIALTGAGVWHLATALGGRARIAWVSVALYASLPLTAALAAGMQTETATAALVVWLAWLVVDASPERVRVRRALYVGAILVGGLFGLKLIAGAQALLLVAWAAWTKRAARSSPLPTAGAVAACLLVAGSSYAYGAAIAGNPFLPLFNGWFASPYFAAVDFQDPRWQAGRSLALPWLLTFRSADYLEGFAGAAGFALVALSGAWLVAIWQRPTRALALVAGAMLALTLLPLQYLRYAFPALVLLLPCMAIAAERISQRNGLRLLVAVCVLNFAFQANAQWMLRTGALKLAVSAAGRDRPLFAEYAPERILLAALRGDARANVLLLDRDKPWIAELGSRGRGISWYSPALQRAADAADADPSGHAWARILRTGNIGDVIVHTDQLPAAQAAGLREAGARRQAAIGNAAWWRLPDRTAP